MIRLLLLLLKKLLILFLIFAIKLVFIRTVVLLKTNKKIVLREY